MSGICGIYSPGNKELASREYLDLMMRPIQHRGSTATHTFVDAENGIAMGHHYLETFKSDIPSASAQWLESDDTVVSLDGIVFNRADAHPEHGNRGSAACIRHFHKKNRNEFLGELDGNFSAAIWDKKRKELTIARDMLGTRPLYYSYIYEKRLLLFASELKAILAHPAVNREMSNEAFRMFLTMGFIPSPLSSFEGIYKIIPGDQATYGPGGEVASMNHWPLPPCEVQEMSFEEAARQVREGLIKSVEKHIGASDEIGISLNGGMDSTVLLVILKILGVPRRETFTFGQYNPEMGVDLRGDLHFSQEIAAKYGTRHHEIIIGNEPEQHYLLPKIIAQFDEPFITPNAYSKYLITRECMQAGLRCCLSGSAAAPAVERFQIKKKSNADSIYDLDDPAKILFLKAARLIPFDLQDKLVRGPKMDVKRTGIQMMQRFTRNIESEYILDRVILGDLRVLGAEKCITVQDRTTYFNNIETRYPFMDSELLTITGKIPPVYKGSESRDMRKAVLKEAFKNEIPESIRERKIIGFPSHYWNRGGIEHLKNTLLSDAALERTGLFHIPVVREIMEQETMSTRKSAGKKVWGLIVAQLWFEKYINENHEIIRELTAPQLVEA